MLWRSVHGCGLLYVNQLHSNERAALMHELFAPDEMAMNVCRTCIGASDYSKSLYSFDDSEQDDLELVKFSIDHDKAYILPALREARKLKSGPLSVFDAMEPAGMDEVQPLHAGWNDTQEQP